MKKLIFILLLLVPSYLYAGEMVTLPYDVVISQPLTDKAEKMVVSIHYSEDGNHYAMLEYRILNQTKTATLYSYSFRIDGTDFTDFVQGFAATLNTRAEAAMSQDLQSRHITQAKP